MNIAKEEAKKIIDNIHDNATWDDIMYQFYVKQKVDTALVAAEKGNVYNHEQVVKRLQK